MTRLAALRETLRHPLFPTIYLPALLYSSMGSDVVYVQDASDTLDGTNVIWDEFTATYVDYKDWSDYSAIIVKTDQSFTGRTITCPGCRRLYPGHVSWPDARF